MNERPLHALVPATLAALQSALAGAPLAAVVLDPQAGVVHFCNAAAQRLLGTDGATDPAAAAALLAAARADSLHWRGTRHPVVASGGEGGALTLWLQGGADTSVRAQLHDAQARLQLAASASGIGIWERDGSSRQFRIDAQAMRLAGLPADAAVPPQAGLLELVDPDDRERVQLAVQRMQDGDALVELRVRARRVDGKAVVLLLRGRRMADLDGGGERLLGTVLDVTAEEHTRAEMRRLNERVRLAAEAAGLGTWSWNVGARSAVWDDQMRRLLHIDDPQFVPTLDWWWYRIAEDDRPRVRAAYDRMYAHGTWLQVEYRIALADGEVRDFVERAVLERDERGRPVHVTGFCWDETARKQVDRERRETLERLRLASESARVGLWERDLESGVGWCNDECSRHYGLPATAAMPSRSALYALVHPDDRVALQQAHESALQTGELVPLEVRVNRPDGMQAVLATRRQLVRRADGRPWKMVGTTLDITRERLAQQQYRTMSDWLRLASRANGIALWHADVALQLTASDDQLAQLLGLPAGATLPAIDAFLRDFVVAEDRDRYRAASERLRQTQAFDEFEYRIRRPDGEVRHLLSRRVPQLDPAGRMTGVLGATIDVTDSRRAEQQLRALSERLQLATRGTGAGVWDWTLEPGALHWDETLYRLHGMAPGTPLTPPQWLAMVVDDDQARVRAATRQHLKAGDGGELEFRIRRSDGALRTVLIRFRLEREQQWVRRVVGIGLDVTELAATRRQLSGLTERLHLATETFGVGIWEHDLVTGERRWSPVMFDLFGLAPSDDPPSYERMLLCLDPDERADIDRRLRRLAREGGPFQADMRVVRGDGSVLIVHGRARRIDGPDGAPLRMLGLCYDVTRDRAAQRELIDATERVRLATAAAGFGTWERDLVTGEGRWDAQMFALYGLPPADRAPSRASLYHLMVAADRDNVRDRWERCARDGTPVELETRIVRPDGTRAILYTRGSPRLDADGRPLRMLGVTIDLTERRRAEEHLRQMSERLDLATAGNGIGVLDWNPGTGEMTWNAPLRRLLDAPDGAPPSIEAFVAACAPACRARLAGALHAAATGEHAGEVELEFARPSGPPRIALMRLHEQHGGHAMGGRVIGILVDLTDALRARDALQGAQERIRLAAAATQLGYWEVEVPGNQVRWEPDMYPLWGLDPAAGAPTRATLVAATHPDDRERVDATWTAAVDGGAAFALEHRVRHPGGRVAVLYSRGSLQRAADGTPRRLVGVTLDITELAETRNALSQANQRVELATAAAGIGIWSRDIASGREDWDAQTRSIFGVDSRFEPTYESWLQLVLPEDRATASLQIDAAYDGARTGETEYRIVRPDGEVRTVFENFLVQRDAQGRAVTVVGTNSDVTDRRSAESALRAKETAERASRAKTEFLSRMSHELRTPLNAILGFAQLLDMDSAHALDDAQRERVTRIQQAGWHLLTLITEILDLSRIESGVSRITMAVVDLQSVLAEAVSLVEADAARRRVVITLAVAADAPATVWADRTRLSQVLLNLLSNAIKYNRESGQLTIGLRSDADGNALIVLRDTGHGMSASQLDRLFQPFNRLGLEQAPIEGSGIGLTIALKLVEQMGGRLTASSEPGVGTEFTLQLQTAQVAQAPDGPAGAQVAPRDDVRGSVLYVEDNAANMALLAELLQLRPNVRLFRAEDGASGLVLAAVCQPDLVLIDMNLPDMSGVDLLARLRAQAETAAIPCVALSANALPSAMRRAADSGFLAYWTKPLDAAAVLAGIDQLLSPPPAP